LLTADEVTAMSLLTSVFGTQRM